MSKRSPFHHGSVSGLLRSTGAYLFFKRRSGRLRRFRVMMRMKILSTLHGVSSEHSDRRSVRLFCGGGDIFARIEKLMQSAESSVFIDMFIWENDEAGRRMLTLCLEAANRGVTVEIVKDAIGDAFELNNGFFATKTSGDSLWKAFWNHPNISAVSGAERNHTKAFVIDGSTLLVTGLNIADRYRSGHDYMVELRGRAFVEAFLSGDPLPDDRVRLIRNTAETSGARAEVLRLIECAHTLILLEQIFLSDRQVIDLLVKKAASGVTVVVILPAKNEVHHYMNMEAVERLLSGPGSGNVLVYLRKSYSHAKAILVDRRHALVGSVNLIESSLDYMGEASILVHGRPSGRFQLKLRLAMERSMLDSRLLEKKPKLTFVQRTLARLGM